MKEEKNEIAIIGFVFSLIGYITIGVSSIIGLILSIIGLRKSKRLDNKNKSFAVAGIVLSIVRLIIVIVLIVLFVLLVGFSQANIVGIPKGYIKKYEYYDKDGFQDYTDYAKYVYTDKNIVIKSGNYKIVTKDDVENIKGYFNNTRSWMSELSRLDEYDFDENIINEGDYVMIITKEGQKIGNSKYKKYDNYSVYFYDVETNTLYYIHSNI